MRRWFLLCACLFIATAAHLRAQESGLGVGIILGEPTGFSFKYWTGGVNAVDGGVAWSFTREGSLHLHADYLWHSFHVFETEERVPLYYGIGGRIKTEHQENARIGVRVPVGIGYLFKDAPVDLFMEIAPIVDFAPSTDVELNAAIGARFWFR
jgi:hypothetical protein